jgi:hypothetical protein
MFALKERCSFNRNGSVSLVDALCVSMVLNQWFLR